MKKENHEEDGSYMVRRNLHSLKQACEELLSMIQEGDDVESWMEHKISVAQSAISDVSDAFSYDSEEGDDDHEEGHDDEEGDDDSVDLNSLLGGCGSCSNAHENKVFLGSGLINEKKQLVTNNSAKKIFVESVERDGGTIRAYTKSGKAYEYSPQFGPELEMLRCEGYGIKIVNEMYEDDDEEDMAPDLKTEMTSFLRSLYPGEGDDSIPVAIYWFAHDYHGGQRDEFYSILSTSDYRPSRLSHGIQDEQDEIAKMMYEDLVEKYGNR